MVSRRYWRLYLLLSLVALVLAFVPVGAFAKPQHKAAAASYYGDALSAELKNCELCHLSDKEIAAADPASIADETQPWNAFGRALAKAGEEPIADRLRALADADADGDGLANELEIFLGSQPGRPSEKPSSELLATTKVKLEKFRRTLPTYPWRPTRPVVRPEVPGEKANPIDAFLAAEQSRQGLTSRQPASKEALLRRVHLDLIGLPPTRQQLKDFLADESPDAYAKVVEQLLASPQYGERWGRHWMDVWRYSDWAGWGEQVRDSHPHIWRWRDWIVESLNADQPYDEMVVDMLAADEAKPGDEQALRATGFLVRNFKLLSREQWMLESVDHTSRAFLGVTFKCAQCHDHMYDPLTHEEYFQFRAIFEPYQVRIDQVPGQLDTKKDGLSRVYDANPDAKTQFYLRGDERTPDKDRVIVPGVPKFLGGELKIETVALPSSAWYPSLRPSVQADLIKKAEAELALFLLEPTNGLTESKQVKHDAAEANLAALKARFAAETAKAATPPDVEKIRQLAREASTQERKAKFLAAEVAVLESQKGVADAELKLANRAKGDSADLLQKVVTLAKGNLEKSLQSRDAAAKETDKESDAYAALGEQYSKTSSGRRLAFAKWLVSRDNPLTARVAVNHLWARHFGRGLVETVDDFGQNGRRPQHPALLDWLAAELMEPTVSLTNDSAKPWSMKHLHGLIVLSNTYRQSAAFDAASAAVDPDNRYYWRFTPRRLEAEAVRDSVLHLAGSLDMKLGGPEIDQNQTLAVPRRSLYFRNAPEKQAPFMLIFDMAAPTECYRRRDSIIPQQALALANSDLTVKQSRKLARTLAAENADSAAFIVAAFEQILSRTPRAEEAAACEVFLTEQLEVLKPLTNGTTTDRNNLDQPSADIALRARESLIHVLFNHHEFVMLQ